MAPLYHDRLERRSEQSALDFAILFGIIAALMVVVCIFWTWVIPRMQHRRSQKLSRRGRNITPISMRSQPRRPSSATHRALHHPISQRTILPTYNPRHETPFPRWHTCAPQDETPFSIHPENTLHSTGSAVWNRAISAPVSTIDPRFDEPFTPKHESAVEIVEAKSSFYTVPRGRDAKHFAGRSADFGDARDFILAVPEPLVLKSRPAGRPPAVVRHLQRYGIPHSNSPATSDKHLHPNKLFRTLQQESVRGSYCSSTTLRLDQNDSTFTGDCDAFELVNMDNKAVGQENTQQNRSCNNSEASSKLGTDITRDQENFEINPSLTAIHRLRSYRSLTGSQIPRMTRAGTISKPKTPINELKKFYGEERSFTAPPMSIPRYGTISSVTTGFGPSSENESISTPATSPFRPSHNLSMLPTPLRPRKGTETLSEIEGTETINPRLAISHKTQDENKNTLPALHIALNRKRDQRSSRGFYHIGRRNKAPPNINTDIQAPTKGDEWPLPSFPNVNPDLSPNLAGRNHPRRPVRASSIYSRDTLGMSLRTPTTVEGSSPMADVFVESDFPESSNPFRSRESIKSRINQWNQRIEGHPHTPRLPRTDNVSPAMSTASIRDYFESVKAEDKGARRFEREI